MTKLATICYVDNGKELLLLHRNKKPQDVHAGKWIGVGGKFEKGESPEDCAKREIFEETGLVATDMKLCGVITFPDFTPNQDWYTYVFKVTAFEGSIKDCDEGSLEWVPYEEVLQKPTWEGDLIFLRWILDNRPFFSAKFTYTENSLQDHSVVFYE
ncbi:NUDIX hydrolase [Streptococcus oriscaviae]|uniref:8-oxo-dGTP diphosphatase n=1 Tax=Streptococcus oriscaviae TaxID=2781599 RepID=A0ABX7YLG3_9STRE|nr:8-oxo-dGTP diphosphatase [Streptococcus oriscaviae]QUE54530.1 8-oxo-dGTP diphosphatase [Streptococcus oriscaviae]